MSAPLIYIIILNWNGIEDTIECLNSLNELDYFNYKTVLVDNGSVKSCKNIIELLFPLVKIIELPKNIGFSGGCNVGIQLALNENADYVWLLNNDTIVDKRALWAMVDEGEVARQTGILGSKIYQYDNPNILDHAGGKIYPWKGQVEHIGCGKKDIGQFNDVKEVDYVTGCSLLAKVEMIRSIGTMDESFFLYWEETDWCIRAKRANWKIRYIPSSVVYHKGSEGLGKISPQKTFYSSRNSLKFINKNYSSIQWLAILWWPRYFFINHLLKGRFDHLKAAIRGLKSFIIDD
jgi:GT2 family glycosyltransferase